MFVVCFNMIPIFNQVTWFSQFKGTRHMPWSANFNETRVWNYTKVVYFNSRAVTLIDVNMIGIAKVLFLE